MLDLNAKNAFRVLAKYLGEKNPTQYEHSIRVAQTSLLLAKRWNVCVEDSVIAALLHDIGKSFSRKGMLSFCARNGLPLYDFEIYDNLAATHGKVSAALFEREFENTDPDRFNSIYDAIVSHVAGGENMSDLAKILFIADNIEPNKRNGFIEMIKSGEITSPNDCIKRIIESKLDRARESHRAPNPFLDCTIESLEDER